MSRILLTFSVFLLTCFSLSSHAQPDSILAKEVIKETNKFRASQGLQPVQYNEALQAIATAHSKDMAAGKVPFGHQGFPQRSDEARRQIPGLRGFASENVAFGKITAAQVLEMWKNSPGHRNNLMGRYKYIGIGIARAADGLIYFTQIFAE